MPLTFDDVDRGTGNMCRELTAPLFGEDPIRVAEDDVRWLVPRGERVERDWRQMPSVVRTAGGGQEDPIFEAICRLTVPPFQCNLSTLR